MTAIPTTTLDITKNPRDDKRYDSDSYDSYSNYSSRYNKIQEMIKAMIQTHMTAIPTTLDQIQY